MKNAIPFATTLFTIAASISVAGCAHPTVAAPQPAPIETVKAADLDSRADVVRRDPVAYLRQVERNCGALKQYKVLFTRLERRGLLFKSLQGPEQIQCWFRRSPFSIRMKWLDERVKYGESTYVEGVENNRVRFTPRHGLFGLPPGLTKVDLQTPVTWGEAQRPISEWGMERLVQATLRSIEEAKPNGGAVVEYRGVVRMDNGRPAHQLHFEYPRDPSVSSIQELYVDLETDLPSGTLLKFADGRVDSMYTYDRLETNVNLTDADFILDLERRPPPTSPEPQP